MDHKMIRCDVADFIAIVRMDHPPVNAQNAQFHHEMMQTFDAISDRDDVRVAVLTGAGKIFSAGADIKARADRGTEPGVAWGHNRTARECFHSVMECRKPVIGALNGAALGAGLAVPPLATSWSRRKRRYSGYRKSMLDCSVVVATRCACLAIL